MQLTVIIVSASFCHCGIAKIAMHALVLHKVLLTAHSTICDIPTVAVAHEPQ